MYIGWWIARIFSFRRFRKSELPIDRRSAKGSHILWRLVKSVSFRVLKLASLCH